MPFPVPERPEGEARNGKYSAGEMLTGMRQKARGTEAVYRPRKMPTSGR